MTTATATAARFTAKALPYAHDALAPAISEETMRYHHDKHYVGYVNKLNELVAGSPYEHLALEEIVRQADGPIFNNAAQAWNHEFYFAQFSSDPAARPEGALAEAIERQFGSLEALKEQMGKASAGLFGSGWTWLAADRAGKLVILSEPNAGNPLRQDLTPLLCLDVWEHAYYLDYRNLRPAAVAAHWDKLDWRTVSERYERR